MHLCEAKMDLSFVSSANELIEQFQRVRTDEAIRYELWTPVSASADDDSLAKATSQLRNAILQFVSHRIGEYLWGQSSHPPVRIPPGSK